MATRRLLVLASFVLCGSACGSTAPEPVDAGPSPSDAAPSDAAPSDAGPLLGSLESFATLASTSEGIAFGVDAVGAPTLYVGVLGASEIVTVGADGTVRPFVSLPRPLGIAARADGNLVVCAKADTTTDAAGVLYEVTPGGMVTPLLSTGPSGLPLVTTNYVAIAPDDSIVFSDSEANLLYRADPDGSNVALVTDAITYPNGLAFSADGATLYVASWDGSKVWALPFDRSTGAYGAPADFLDGVEQVDGIVTLASGALILVTSTSGVLQTTPAGAPTTLLRSRSLLLPANGSAGFGVYGQGWVYLSSLGNAEVWRLWVGEPGAPLPVR